MLLDGQTTEEPETQAAVEPEAREPETPAIPPPPEPDKQVTLTPPKSRRARIEEEYTNKVSSLADMVTKLTQGMSERDRQVGELTGHIQALSQRQYAPPQQQYAPPPQLPDPEDLERRAQEAIDRKDFTGYQRLTREASVADAMRRIAPALQRMQQQQQPAPQQQNQIPPALMTYFAAYPDVASHPRAMELLASKNVELDARGFAPGAERVRQVFDEVRAVLSGGKPVGRASFSQGSAGALSGVPTRSSNGGGGGGSSEAKVALTTEERIVAKRAGFSEEKMANLIAQSHPDRVIR